MKRLIIISAAVIVLIGIILLFIFFKKGEKDNPLHTTGIVEGTEVNLSAKTAGKISELCCKEGDVVNEGNVVIRLESDDITASVKQAKAGIERAKAEINVSESAIENSKANIESAEAEVKNAEADVERARAQMEEAKREMERANALYKDGFISKAELDSKITNYDTAVSGHEASKAKLRASISRKDAAAAQLNTSISQLYSSKARLKEAEAGLLYQMARLNDTIIKAPISGTVVFKAAEKGETISPGITILTIVDLGNLWVRIDMEETLIGSVELGTEAIIKAEGIKARAFKGKVSEIGRYAEFATQRDVTQGRQDIKTFKIKIRLEDNAGMLKPGMTVSVEMPIKR